MNGWNEWNVKSHVLKTIGPRIWIAFRSTVTQRGRFASPPHTHTHVSVIHLFSSVFDVATSIIIVDESCDFGSPALKPAMIYLCDGFKDENHTVRPLRETGEEKTTDTETCRGGWRIVRCIYLTRVSGWAPSRDLGVYTRNPCASRVSVDIRSTRHTDSVITEKGLCGDCCAFGRRARLMRWMPNDIT